MSFFQDSQNHTITGGEFTGVQIENGGILEQNAVCVGDGGKLGFTDVWVDHVETLTNVRVDKVENVLFERKNGLDILQPHVVMSAVHNSGQRFDPPKCHPDTRTAVIARIKDWIMSPYEPEIFWLHGAVGAGKSALAQTFAELCYRQPEIILLGTFFFSRTSLREGRGDGTRVAATVVYQAMQAIPEITPFIEQALAKDPLIFGRSLEVQFQELLFEPLLSVFLPYPLETQIRPFSRPLFIVIDGLDECDSRDVQAYLLQTIQKMSTMADRLQLRILVASRPEVHIRDIFHSIKRRESIVELNLSRDPNIHDDIRRYIMKECDELKTNHRLRQYIPRTWPAEHMIEQIIRKSSGHFIYAATVLKYIQSYRYLPHERMDILLGISPPLTNHSPLADLDALYAYILEQAEDFDSVSRVLAILLLPPPDIDYGRSSKLEVDKSQQLTPAFLETLLFLPPGRLELLLTDLVSIVNIEDPKRPISFFHASFLDYLYDRSRSGKFYLGNRTRLAHADLARGLARYISLKGVRIIIPPVHTITSDIVPELQAHTTKVLGYYASFFFHYACSRPRWDFCPDLLEFDFAASFRAGYDTQRHKQELSLVLIFYSEFLGILEDYGAEDAVTRNMPAYCTCIEQFLNFYKKSKHHGLDDALALADYDIDSVTVYTMQHVLQVRAPSVWAAIIQNGLHLGRLALVWHSMRGRGMFQRCLLEVLWDPKRSRQHALSADKRLRALIRCLQSFCITQGALLEGVEEFDLSGIDDISLHMPDATESNLWQNKILTDLALLSRSMALLSKIPRGTATSRRLHLILSNNYDMLQQILRSNRLYVSTSTKAAASELDKVISDFLIENDETVSQYRRPSRHLTDNEMLGTVGSFVRNAVANFARW